MRQFGMSDRGVEDCLRRPLIVPLHLSRLLAAALFDHEAAALNAQDSAALAGDLRITSLSQACAATWCRLNDVTIVIPA